MLRVTPKRFIQPDRAARPIPVKNAVDYPFYNPPVARQPVPYHNFTFDMNVARSDQKIEIKGNFFVFSYSPGSSDIIEVRFNSLNNDKVQLIRGQEISGIEFNALFLTNPGAVVGNGRIMYGWDSPAGDTFRSH